jgi:hypothetical protein
MFDFDWAFPSIAALAGLVGGVAGARQVPRTGGRFAVLGIALLLIAIAAGVAGFALDPHPGEPLRPVDYGALDCGRW